MKAIIVVLWVLLAHSFAFGQQNQRGGKALERIHAAKIAYLTDRLHLSAEQSVAFIPVYNEYEAELVQYRRETLRKNKGSSPAEVDDETARQYIDDNLDYQQHVIDLKRKYNDKFLKVITARQLADLNQAEREFKQLLMERLKNRREQGGGRKFRR